MDRDGKVDLVGIFRRGRTGTEVHVFSGASEFKTAILHDTTGLHVTDAGWGFAVVP